MGVWHVRGPEGSEELELLNLSKWNILSHVRVAAMGSWAGSFSLLFWFLQWESEQKCSCAASELQHSPACIVLMASVAASGGPEQRKGI